MDEFLTYCGRRNDKWRSHTSAKDVRRAIQYQGGRGRSVVVFERLDGELLDYREVHPVDWPERFGI